MSRRFLTPATAAFAAYILENIDDAREFAEVYEGDNVGKAFAETVDCECASAPEIRWGEINEVFLYKVMIPVVEEKTCEIEPEVEKVTDEDLPEKVLDVADKLTDEALDKQDSTENTDDIEV